MLEKDSMLRMMRIAGTYLMSHCPFPFAIKWLAQQSYIVMTCLLKLDIVSCIYCLHHGKIQMLRSRPPAATLYKFTEEALGLVLDGFLMGRFEVTSSWHTSTEAEILCLTTRDWKSSPYYRSKSQKVNSERYSHLHRKKKKKKGTSCGDQSMANIHHFQCESHRKVSAALQGKEALAATCQKTTAYKFACFFFWGHSHLYHSAFTA